MLRAFVVAILLLLVFLPSSASAKDNLVGMEGVFCDTPEQAETILYIAEKGAASGEEALKTGNELFAKEPPPGAPEKYNACFPFKALVVLGEIKGRVYTAFNKRWNVQQVMVFAIVVGDDMKKVRPTEQFVIVENTDAQAAQ